MAKPSSNAGAIVIPLFVFVAALGAEIVIAKKAKDEKKEKMIGKMCGEKRRRKSIIPSKQKAFGEIVFLGKDKKWNKSIYEHLFL